MVDWLSTSKLGVMDRLHRCFNRVNTKESESSSDEDEEEETEKDSVFSNPFKTAAYKQVSTEEKRTKDKFRCFFVFWGPYKVNGKFLSCFIIIKLKEVCTGKWSFLSSSQQLPNMKLKSNKRRNKEL